MDGQPPSQGWSVTIDHPPSKGWSTTNKIWLPTFPRMVTQPQKDGHLPYPTWSPTTPRMLAHHHQDAPGLNLKNQDQVTTAINGHPPSQSSKRWLPAIHRMFTLYPKDGQSQFKWMDTQIPSSVSHHPKLMKFDEVHKSIKLSFTQLQYFTSLDSIIIYCIV